MKVSVFYPIQYLIWKMRNFLFEIRSSFFHVPRTIKESGEVMSHRYQYGKYRKPYGMAEKYREEIAREVTRMETWENYRDGLVDDGDDEYEIRTSMMMFENTLWDQKVKIFTRNIVTETLSFFEYPYHVMFKEIGRTVDFNVRRSKTENERRKCYDLYWKFFKTEGIPENIEKYIVEADLKGNEYLSEVLRKCRSFKKRRKI